MNKTEFVRSNPHLTAAQLVQLAEEKHKTKISTAHVYTIRSSLKRANARVASEKPVAREVAGERGRMPLRVRVDQMCTRFVDRLLDAVRSASVQDLT